MAREIEHQIEQGAAAPVPGPSAAEGDQALDEERSARS
jgi:hypothetical protein